GLTPVPATQVIARDRHAEYLWACACAGASVEQFATEVRHLQRTEVREVEEPFRSGQKGSSAMPHKRNPVTCERLSAMAAVLLALVAAGRSRDDAYRGVQDVAMAAWEQGRSFRSLLEADERVPLTDEQLDEAFSLERALRNVGSVFEALETVE